MPDPQGAGGADEASGAQIGAEIPGLATIPSHEHGRHHRRQARSEDARELIDERNGGIADGGVEAVGEEARHGPEHGGVHDTERQGQSEADIKIVVGIVMEHPEGRETEDAEQQGAEAEHAGLADTVGDIAPEGDEEGHDHGGDHDHREGGRTLKPAGLGQVAQREYREGVEGHAVDEAGAHTGHHHLGITLEGVEQGVLHFRHLGLGFREVLGFMHGGTDIGTDEQQPRTHDERDAPAPADEGFVGKHCGEEADDAGGQQQAERKPHLRQAGVKSALVRGSRLERHQHGAAPFAAEAEALRNTAQDEQDRGPNPDAGIRRNASDGHGPRAHDHKGKHQHLFAADFIAEMAKHEAAQRTGHKADREGGERQHGPDAVVEFGEVQMIEDKPRDNAVQEEVIPLYDGPYE